jgi:hypothetical protein
MDTQAYPYIAVDPRALCDGWRLNLNVTESQLWSNRFRFEYSTSSLLSASPGRCRPLGDVRSLPYVD